MKAPLFLRRKRSLQGGLSLKSGDTKRSNGVASPPLLPSFLVLFSSTMPPFEVWNRYVTSESEHSVKDRLPFPARKTGLCKVA